jgi:hypothetical protein
MIRPIVAKGFDLSRLRAAGLVALFLLAGCEKNQLLVKRSACPAVAVPNYTGDLTTFANGGTAAGDIDVVAAITNVRGVCDDGEDRLGTAVSFDVLARRNSSAGARSVALPFFVSVVQGGNLLVSKQFGSVTINFADGQLRAQASAAAHADVSRAAATLSEAMQTKINRNRKPGDLEAATDPLADPEVKAAVRATTFEVLVGFRLSDDELAYNAAK